MARIRIQESKTLGAVIDQYIRLVLPHRKNPNDARMSDEPRLRWWKKHIGDINIADISVRDISHLREELLATPTRYGKPRAPATVNRSMSLLSHVFTVAIREEYCEANPCKRIPKYQESRGRVRFLSEPERNNLLVACRDSTNPQLYAFVLIALCTGARKGEIQSLEWHNVDLKRRVINYIDTKNGERRTVPLVERLYDELRAMRRETTGRVFEKSMDFYWRVAVKNSRVKNFRFHDLRHTCASYMAMSGASTLEIADVLGHKTLAMVKRYSHLNVDSQRVALERMEKFSWEAN